MNKPTAFFSHQIDKLASKLRENLYQKGRFSRKIIVIPSMLQKEYLLYFFADTCEIFAGAKWAFLDQALDLLLSITSRSSYRAPSVELLTLHIEQEMQQAISENDSAFTSLQEYLASSNKAKLHNLATYMASLFLLYGTLPKHILQKWVVKNGWKQRLFKRLEEHWDFRNCFFASHTCSLLFPIEIHFFHTSFLPPLFVDFFQSLSPQLTCYFYLFAPTFFYWGDLYSDSKRAFLSRLYTRKEVQNNQIYQLDQYVQDRNPLVANYAKLGQSLINYALEEAWSIEEDFIEEKGSSLLSLLQRDLLHLKNPQKERVEIVSDRDTSIQLHKASSKLQEVEILYRHLAIAISQDSSLEGSDIIVFATSLSDNVISFKERLYSI